ncbi:MAG TPA: DUF4826 family protein [Gammaproteobacteria bacterium]|nr:DUF4826 family protein [Gammaproteobacteria bacterium]
MSSPAPFDEAAFAEWHKDQQQQVAEYLRHLEVFDTDITGEWLWIIPHRAMLGRVRPKQGDTPVLWVITGVVPTDHAEVGAARNCREAARYFALKWQLEAARLEKSGGNGSASDGVNWEQASGNIAARAEWLNDLTQDPRRWNPDGSPFLQIDHEAAQA